MSTQRPKYIWSARHQQAEDELLHVLLGCVSASATARLPSERGMRRKCAQVLDTTPSL